MHKFWRSAAECSVASLALVSLTIVCSLLHFSIATVGFLYVIVVVVLARVGSFVSSIVTSILAALCLIYLDPPDNSFRVDDPLDYVAIAAFLVTSLLIARLVATVRKQTEDALSSVSYRVIEAEEQERHRIADDLHEDIGQRLTLLVLEIEQIKTGTTNSMAEASNRIDAVVRRTSEIAADVKTSAHELYSPRLEYLDIGAVMNSFCKDYGRRRGVEIDFKSDIVRMLLPPDITVCLFRVLQEGLHNAVKHSGARQFSGRLWRTSDAIHLKVSDCGVGFDLDATEKTKGLGLNRMQERLKLVNGTLSIESRPKRGSTIHARVPVSFGTDSVHAGRMEALESRVAIEELP
jgi:signal transduction histidine kinase